VVRQRRIAPAGAADSPGAEPAAVYDAHYLALAERLGAEMWTADRRLCQAVGAALPWVRLVE